MVDLLPSSPDTAAVDDPDPLVVGVDSEAADDMLAALRSETGRAILDALYDDPATASALADRTDTTVQNVQYHLERLGDAGLVEVADTVYSEKGREMKVYAPSARPLVVYAGSDDQTTDIETAVRRLLGGVGILGLASVLLDRLFRVGVSPGGAPLEDEPPAAGGTPTPGERFANATSTSTQGATERAADTGTPAETATATGTPAPTETPVATGTPTETAAATGTPTPAPGDLVATGTPSPTEVAPPGAGGTGAVLPPLGASPGLYFFAGGLAVLLVGFAVWYVRRG